MNVRKPADYSAMYRELTEILARKLPQMDEIYAIGKAISQRPEKGAAVAAAEFLQAKFPGRAGFSPRNVRRMRDFYQVYENDEPLLRLAAEIGWTLNVVIMEAELTRAQRMLCLQKAATENLSKKELLEIILSGAFAEEYIDDSDRICYNVTGTNDRRRNQVQVRHHYCYATKGEQWIKQCWQKRILLLDFYYSSSASDFLSIVHRFPCLQAWLGSS